MNNTDIINFKNSIANLSLDELEKMAAEYQSMIGRMVLNTDLVIKAAIVDSLINEKKNG